MSSFFLSNWSPPDDPARPLPAEGRPWPSDDYDGGEDDGENDDDNEDGGEDDDDDVGVQNVHVSGRRSPAQDDSDSSQLHVDPSNGGGL